jgi:hypothetical protein
MNRPIILGNAPSSGSSLLQVLLQRHPSIAGRGEIAILDKPGLYEESPASFRKNIGRWLDRGYPEVYFGGGADLFVQLDQYPWTRAELREFCLSCHSFPEMVKGFFAHNSRVWGRPRWLEKTPPNIYCFRQIRDIFPDAQFIQIVRDARDSMASYYRRTRDPFLTVGQWYYAMMAGLQYTDWDNFLVVRYEDLVQNPAQALRRVCEFLGEAYTDSLLEAEAPSVEKLPSWRSHQQGPVTNSSVGQYVDSLTDDVKSMFASLRLTKAGRKLLPYGGEKSGLLTPFEIQERLGYGLDGLETKRAASYRERLECRRRFWRWRLRRWRRFHTWAKCPAKVV